MNVNKVLIYFFVLLSSCKADFCIKGRKVQVIHIEGHIIPFLDKQRLVPGFQVKYTAIPYRASTGPEQGFPCEVFLTGKNLFSLQENPFLIAGTLFSLQGCPCEKNFTGKTLFWSCTGPVRDCSVCKSVMHRNSPREKSYLNDRKILFSN